MRGVYEASYLCPGVNSLRTLLLLTAPAGKVCEVLSARIGNAGNLTNAQLAAALQFVSSLGTPTATTLTPTRTEQGDQASGATAVANVTAGEPTYASNTQRGLAGFASVGGWDHSPVPEERLYVAPGATWGLRLIGNTVPAATDFTVFITWREIG